ERPVTRWERVAPSASSTSCSRTISINSRIESRSFSSKVTRQGLGSSWRNCGAVLLFAMAYSSCSRDLQRRDPGFVFNDFSGEYAFHFSTGIGTEPRPLAEVVVVLLRKELDCVIAEEGERGLPIGKQMLLRIEDAHVGPFFRDGFEQ